MTDNITKLYGSLTSQELALLAFHHLTDVNEIELGRIASAVPFKTYRCRDLEYQDRLDGLFNMAALFSIEHWRIYARSLEALVASHFMAGDSEKERQMFEVQEIWQSRLLALDTALKDVCKEQGIDEESVRRLTGADKFKATMPKLNPDEEYEKEMKVCLARLLPK